MIAAASGTALRYWRGCSVMPYDGEWDADLTVAFVLARLRTGSVVCMHEG
ncbi:MAG: hypothetical protein H0W90_15110 [Actinobacteria bacterium]|nr:hypothetical protein [Actinomycetota bacterium]